MTIEATRERLTVELHSDMDLAGFESPGSYSDVDTSNLINLHQAITGKYGAESPYYKFAGKDKAIVFKHLLDAESKLYLVGGRIGAFSQEQLAVFIQEQANSYVHKKTMGKRFPVGNVDAEQELLGQFINGFSEDDEIIIVTSERTPDKIEIVGGVRMVRGTSDALIAETAIKGVEARSTLPTFNALQKKEPFSPDLVETAVSERDAICVTRYWTQTKGATKAMELPMSSVAPSIIAAMPIVYSLDAMKDKGITNIPKVAIFDTHYRSIMEHTKETYGAIELAYNGQMEATPEIMSTILGFHYGTDNEIGGYGDSLYLGMFETEKFLEGAYKFFGLDNQK